MRPGIDLVMVTVLALISALGAGPAGGDGQADQPAGLALARPYSRGKIPVILIHGLGSSPKSWAPMIEALEADPLTARALPVLDLRLRDGCSRSSTRPTC